MSKAAALRQTILEVVREHERARMLPTSIRFIYYELIAREIVSKVRTGKRRTDQNTIDAITQLHESDAIPWGYIEDETRELSDYTGYATMREAALASLEYARLDAWEDNPPLIITESRSLAGVLHALIAEHAARIASTNGPCAGFLHNKLAPALREGDTVIYLGDADFSGGHIEANTRDVLERRVGELDWKRLAVTDEQIADFNLTVIQKYDARTKSYHDAVETEALGQARIVAIVRDRLEELLPEPLADVHEREEAEREEIADLLRT
jgi:hypothetical protein